MRRAGWIAALAAVFVAEANAADLLVGASGLIAVPQGSIDNSEFTAFMDAGLGGNASAVLQLKDWLCVGMEAGYYRSSGADSLEAIGTETLHVLPVQAIAEVATGVGGDSEVFVKAGAGLSVLDIHINDRREPVPARTEVDPSAYLGGGGNIRLSSHWTTQLNFGVEIVNGSDLASRGSPLTLLVFGVGMRYRVH